MREREEKKDPIQPWAADLSAKSRTLNLLGEKGELTPSINQRLEDWNLGLSSLLEFTG